MGYLPDFKSKKKESSGAGYNAIEITNCGNDSQLSQANFSYDMNTNVTVTGWER